jgi:hypothetical protein
MLPECARVDKSYTPYEVTSEHISSMTVPHFARLDPKWQFEVSAETSRSDVRLSSPQQFLSLYDRRILPPCSEFVSDEIKA